MRQRKISEKDLITTKEVADILRVRDKHVVYQLVYNRKIPYYRVGGQYLFDKQEIMETILKNRVSPKEKYIM